MIKHLVWKHENGAGMGAHAPKGLLSPVTPNAPALMAFLAVFAGVVGPVNVFLLAGERRRQRLFWTTPLISVTASALLLGFILLQDGLGGRGMRSALVYVSPKEHSESVLQEQTCRTGLLLGAGFKTRDPALLEFVAPAGGRESSRDCDEGGDGVSYGGAWFASRSLQTHRIEAVVPTRAEITLLNAAEVEAGSAAPVILSSFPAPLMELTYTDAQHRRWKGKEVQTGLKQELAPGAAGPVFSSEEAPNSPQLYVAANTFTATSRDSSVFVDTLRSIHWMDSPVTYFGPVTIP